MSGRADELINAEIDGVITGPERAELNRLLLADPAVRALREQYLKASRALDSIEVPSPEGLRESVLSALPATSFRGARSEKRGFASKPVFRYAAVLVGGVLVSALAFELGGLDGTYLGSHSLSGTIAPMRQQGNQLDLDLDRVKGFIELTGSADAPVVVARLSATDPVYVVARQGDREVRLSGFVPAPQQGPVERSAALGHAGVTSAKAVEVEVVDAASGAVLRATTLRAGAGDR